MDNQYKHSNAAVSATLLTPAGSPAGGCVCTVNINKGAAGNLDLHDCATTGGIGAGTLVASFDTASANCFVLEARFRLGIVMVQVGTADTTILWD